MEKCLLVEFTGNSIFSPFHSWLFDTYDDAYEAMCNKASQHMYEVDDYYDSCASTGYCIELKIKSDEWFLYKIIEINLDTNDLTYQ